jgi:hypothetical protein
MASSRYNNNGNGNGNGRNGKNETKFCAVCHAAGRPGYDTHFVRADKFDRFSEITCPYLLSIKCRNCGGTGHTSSYCNASRASSITAPPAPAPHPTSLARVRLPPISSSSYSSSYSKQPPRIVFPGLEKEQKERDFPQLVSNRKPQSSSTTSLPPLPLSFVSLRQNDEPLLKRGPPEASPVHSPAAPSNKVIYNKRGNAFADLASSSDDEENEHLSPIHSPASVGRYRATKPSSWGSSWASLVAPAPVVVAVEHVVVLKPKPRVIAPNRLEPLLPLAFKPRKVASGAAASAVPKVDKEKLWGDTDSEDDEEFLKRGLLQ